MDMIRASVLAALSGALGLVGSGVVGFPAAATTPSCFGQPATIVGTAGEDWLVGTPGVDVIYAGAGDDFVQAGNGARDVDHPGVGDLIWGGLATTGSLASPVTTG